MQKSQFTATITDYARLPSSRACNPRYLLTLDNGKTYKTAIDAGCGYSVTNFVERRAKPVRITLRRDGQIVNIVCAETGGSK